MASLVESNQIPILSFQCVCKLILLLSIKTMEKLLTKSINNRSIRLKNKPESWCNNSTKCVPELPSQDNTISYIFLNTIKEQVYQFLQRKQGFFINTQFWKISHMGLGQLPAILSTGSHWWKPRAYKDTT